MDLSRKLVRIPQKGVIAGVIAGFAEYFALDVTLLRVIFVFFVLVTGFFPGVLGYILAMLIMPIDLSAQDGEPSVHERTQESSPRQS